MSALDEACCASPDRGEGTADEYGYAHEAALSGEGKTT